MNYCDIPKVEFLEHHGVKGQKWGVRRFQNADGTLTEKGRKRYNKAVYKEVITRTELGRSMVKGKLMSEIVDDIRPSYKKFKSTIDGFASEVEKIKESESYKKELNKIKTKAKKDFVEIEENGVKYMTLKKDVEANETHGKGYQALTKKDWDAIQEQLAFDAVEKTIGYKRAKTKLEKESIDYMQDVTEKVEDSLGKYRNVMFDKSNLGYNVSAKIGRYLHDEIPDIPTRSERKSAGYLNVNVVGKAGAISGALITSSLTGLSPIATGAIAGALYGGTSAATKYTNPKYKDYDEKDQKK